MEAEAKQWREEVSRRQVQKGQTVGGKNSATGEKMSGARQSARAAEVADPG